MASITDPTIWVPPPNECGISQGSGIPLSCDCTTCRFRSHRHTRWTSRLSFRVSTRIRMTPNSTPSRKPMRSSPQSSPMRQVIYRLGQSIEHRENIPCESPEGFCQVGPRVREYYRHYNEGWADGFHYGIKRWEIWNEPDITPCWTGTQQQFATCTRRRPSR